jgi:uncharacterized protein YneF (UPF0154 family)
MNWWMLLLIAPFVFVALVILAVWILGFWIDRRKWK